MPRGFSNYSNIKMITTTTTPSAETPSATTPSAIPSADQIDPNLDIINHLKWHMCVLGQHLVSHQNYLDEHEMEWKESYKEDDFYLEDLFYKSYLASDIALSILHGIRSKIEKLEVK